MNVLLTGMISPIIWGMVDRLERNDHHVTVVGRFEGFRPPHSYAVLHDMLLDEANAQHIIKPGYFHAVVFFFAYQSEETRDLNSVKASVLDMLFQALKAAEQNGVERFILVTDQRVFGSSQRTSEEEVPAPDSISGVLIKAAEDSLSIGRAGAMKTLVVRVTNLYWPGAEDSFFSRALRSSRDNKPMVIEGTADSPCDFLHIDDLAQFVSLYFDSDAQKVVHLAYGDMCTYARVVEALKAQLPTLEVFYTGRTVRDASLIASRSVQQMDWVPKHHWAQELGLIVSGGRGTKPRKKRFRQASVQTNRLLGKALPWVELVAFGWLAQWLTSMSKVYATFRFADFWLFYPVLIGSLHGGLIGILAALIASVFYGLDWVAQGNDLYLLLYNIDNWLPLMVYLLAGGLFGYMHDKDKESRKMLEREKEERDKEAAAMEGMYRQASEDRSQLQKQVMRTRDSYGRIYAITRKLDTMQPEQVFLSTLNVVEETMQNHTVAIYSRVGNTSFARLVAHSRGLEGKIDKSPDVAQFPLMRTRLDLGETFINTTLEPGYPAIAAPILQDGRALAMIILWELPFDQQTLYHHNLFSILIGLVQSAMVRTLRYFELSRDLYRDHTHIMTDQAFRSTLGVYRQMKKQGNANFLLLRARKAECDIPAPEMDHIKGSLIRATDIVGQADNDDYMVLLPQAGMQDMPLIESRFREAGLTCTVVAEED